MPQIARDEHFGPLFRPLAREASLARSAAIFGLNALRHSNVADSEGSFYTASFELAIAAERLMKLAVILDWMETHGGVPPRQADIKDYLHDLNRLLGACRDICSRRGLACLDQVANGSVEEEVLDLLANFARKGRYFNLDTVGSAPGGRDPLVAWDALIKRVFVKEVPDRKKSMVGAWAAFVNERMDAHFGVATHDLGGKFVGLGEVTLAAGIIREALPYVCLHVVRLLRELCDLVHVLGEAAQATASSGSRMGVPCFSEFFTFLDDDVARTLRKRRWP